MNVEKSGMLGWFLLLFVLGALSTNLFGSRSASAEYSSVNYGQNPVVSHAGTVPMSTSATVVTSPSTQDIVFTDVSLMPFTNDGDCLYFQEVELRLLNGTVVGSYEVTNSFLTCYYDCDGAAGTVVQQHLSSGIRVPAGESLEIEVSMTSRINGRGNCSNSSSSGVRYTLSGYMAR